jgi:hypothetical protein
MSHRGSECRIYPDRTTILTLCTRCRQGLHETCKSKRRDLVQLPPEGVAAIKQVLQAHDLLLRGLLPQGPTVTYPGSSAPALQNKSRKNKEPETSDEDN